MNREKLDITITAETINRINNKLNDEQISHILDYLATDEHFFATIDFFISQHIDDYLDDMSYNH